MMKNNNHFKIKQALSKKQSIISESNEDMKKSMISDFSNNNDN